MAAQFADAEKIEMADLREGDWIESINSAMITPRRRIRGMSCNAIATTVRTDQPQFPGMISVIFGNAARHTVFAFLPTQTAIVRRRIS